MAYDYNLLYSDVEPLSKYSPVMLHLSPATRILNENPVVAVNFLFQLIFVFPLFLGMVMYAYEFETKEKQKLIGIKN